MKKLLLFFGLAISSLTTFAQGTTYGIKTGLNFSEFTGSFSGRTSTTESLMGFHIGAVVDFGLGKFSIQPGFLISSKGGKVNEETGYVSTTLNYIEVPINLLFKQRIGNGKFFVGGGPYLAFATSGKNTENDISEDVQFGKNSGEINSSDFGLNFLAGYQLDKGFGLNLNYGLGFSNLYNGDFGPGSIKNKTISVSVSYFLK
ncbi:MAG: porin family protein [Mucilaginibacter sp.]